MTACFLQLQTLGTVDHVAVPLLHDLDVGQPIFVPGQQVVSGLLESELTGPYGVVNRVDEWWYQLLVVN